MLAFMYKFDGTPLGFLVNDLQFRKMWGHGAFRDQVSHVLWIEQHPADRVGLEFCPVVGAQATRIQFFCHCVCADTLVECAAMYFLHDQHFFRINLLVLDWGALFVYTAIICQPITILYGAACKDSGFGHLPDAGLDAGGGLAGLAGRLPKPDVVEQVIHMIIKFLLALASTPDFYAMFDEPFHNKWCFVLAASKPVEHKDKENIELALFRICFDELQFIAFFGRHLVA